MDDTVKLGVIGCGVIGKTHANAAARLPNVRLEAVADINRAAAAEVGAKHNVAKVYGRAEELIADPAVEAVILALPACARTPLCLKAFEQGKHVLNEKPLSMNPEETAGLIAARRGLVAASCTSRLRHTASVQAAAQFLATGALGDLRVIRARAIVGATPPPSRPPIVWRYMSAMNAGGIMSNWGCYDLDTMLGILNWSLRPERVLGRTWTIQPEFRGHIAPGSDGETHVAALITCAGGVAFTYERGEQVPRAGETAWEITGTRGTLHLKIVPGDNKALIFDRAVPDKGIVSETVWQGSDNWDTIHTSLIADFVEAIQTGRPPATTFEQGAVVQKITHAIYDSSRAGKEVVVA